jgi:hypothetical protein
MITLKNRKTELLIEEILKRTKFSDPVEYLEARVRSDFEKAIKNKKIE